jgi:hypothetical protein
MFLTFENADRPEMKRGSKMATGTRHRQYENCDSETLLRFWRHKVKHQEEMKFQHPEPLAHGRFLHAMTH